MRTTLNIDEKLLEDVVRVTGQRSKSKAVNEVMVEYLRRKAIDEIRAMAGRIRIDDVRKEQKAEDLRRQTFLDNLRGD